MKKVQIYLVCSVWLCIYHPPWRLLNCVLYKCSYVLYVSFALFMWLVLWNSLSIRACWYVGICMCTNY